MALAPLPSSMHAHLGAQGLSHPSLQGEEQSCGRLLRGFAQALAHEPAPCISHGERADPPVFFWERGQGSAGKEGGELRRDSARSKQLDQSGGVLKNSIAKLGAEGLLQVKRLKA